MKRELIKKIALFVAALATCTSFIPTSAYAATVQTTTSACVTVSDAKPVEIVTNYLEAVKNLDLDTAVSTLRQVGLTEKQQKADLSEILEDPEAQIAIINDVTLVEETSDTATLSITVQHGDGSITQSPVSLEKDNGQYKFNRIIANDNVIKKATKTDTSKSLKSLKYSQTQLTDWDLDSDVSGPYRYSDTFSAQNISYFSVNAWSGGKVELVVVKKGVFSDTELTDRETLSGNYDDSQTAKLYIKSGSSVKNAKLRVGFVQACRCYGEIYAIS